MDSDGLHRLLRRIDGRGYKAYKQLQGIEYRVNSVRVKIVKVQGDPFAPPSIVRVEIPVSLAGSSARYPIPVADYLARIAYRLSKRYSMRGEGEGHSGEIRFPRPGPIILTRNSSRLVRVGDGYKLVLRFWVGLPSRRRRILGDVARRLLVESIPRLARDVVGHLRDPMVSEYIRVWREQEYIRSKLSERGLVSFVGDGSILPRSCGGCEEPLRDAVPFESPPSLRVEFELPTGRTVSGMGVREGLTVIVGPAFHGKTTLLNAIGQGVWNHIPGDGRELVVTRRDAFWVQSENGRRVSCVDISPWIEYLPGLRDPKCWSASNASGATSAMASLQEAVEAGSRVILIDEDWTATNFIHRDIWTEEVTGKKTLLTISELAGSLKEAGVSVVIVASGSDILLSSADTVIVMDEYKPVDATEYARRRVSMRPDTTVIHRRYSIPGERVIVKSLELGKVKLRGSRVEGRSIGSIDLSACKQMEDDYQLHTAVRIALRVAKNRGSIVGLVQEYIHRLIEDGGLGMDDPSIVEVRWLDVVCVVNRFPFQPGGVRGRRA
ncbi:MAG: ABC-ATPase domain-containing protein [Desulfurococcales archaeon]|nr:ABC-ATPase domain-containing protein [Desulfurococcales archaeon]